MSVSDVTVYDHAMGIAIARGWTFSESEKVGKGVIAIDSHKGTVAVHPGSVQITIRMNTEGGSLLPDGWDKKK